MDDDRMVFRCPTRMTEKIDAYVARGDYMNRADAGRDLVRLGLQIKEGSDRIEKKQRTHNGNGLPHAEEAVGSSG